MSDVPPDRRTAPAGESGRLTDFGVLPGPDDYELRLACQAGEDGFGASVLLDYATPLEALTLVHPLSGRAARFTHDDLLAAIGRGYDVARAPAPDPALPPRVAFTVKHGSIRGGGTIVLYRWANWLAERGVRVTIYSNDVPPEWTTLHARHRTIRVPRERYAAIDEPVVVVYSVLELPDLLRHADLRGKRVYHLCQGAEEFHLRPPVSSDLLAPVPIYDLLNALPVGRIAVSPHLARYFEAKYGQRPLLVPNGIDTGLFTPGPARAPDARRFAVLVSGNPSHPLKGVATVREALARLAARRRDLSLHLVNVCGEAVLDDGAGARGGFTSDLRCDLSPEVMRDAYRAADVYVNASWYEGFGLPSLEAMACGTPVVQARNHGLDGIVEDGRECLLVPPGDPAALAGALERLHDDAGLRARLAARGRETAARHDLATQRRALLSVFSGILGAELAPAERAAATAGPRPRFSVLVPSYNQAGFLGPALDSLRAQTCPDWEALVVNDGSTDGTAEVIARYERMDPRIRGFHQPNGGVAAALNRGLAEARGEWIAWLSSDDLHLPDKLEVQLRAIEADPGARLLHTNYLLRLEEQDRTVPSGIDVRSFIPPVDEQVIRFLFVNYVNGITVCVHRSVFDAVGGFDPDYRCGQDFDLWLRAAARFRSTYLDQATAVTRVHPGQGTALFHQAGIYDSARAALAFLNRHAFEALFPWSDLDRPEHATRAVAATLHCALQPAAFVARCGFGPALLDRAREWLAGRAPPAIRTLVERQLAASLARIGNAEVTAAVRPLCGGGAFRFAPYDARGVLRRQARACARRGEREEAAALERYLERLRAGAPPARAAPARPAVGDPSPAPAPPLHPHPITPSTGDTERRTP